MTAHAQDFTPGYVVLSDDAAAVGDTLRGDVRDRRWRRNPDTVTFRTDDGETRTYSVDDLAAFHVGNTTYVRQTVSIDQRGASRQDVKPRLETTSIEDTVFLLRIIDGPISLYSYRDDRTHFYVDAEEVGFTELIYYVQRVELSGGRISYPETKQFRFQLNEYRAAICPEQDVPNFDYTVEDISGFVQRCNGDDAFNMAEDFETRFNPTLERSLGLRGGYGGIEQADVSTSGVSGGLSFTALVSRSPRFNHLSLLLGANLNYLSVSGTSTEVESAVETCTDICRTRSTEYRTVSSTSALVLGTEIGLRGRINLGSVQPFLDVGGRLNYPITYNASVDRTQFRYLSTETNPEKEILFENEVSTPGYEWSSLQVGYRLGLGAEWSAWEFRMDAVRGARLTGLAGFGKVPATWQVGLTTARRF